MALRRDLSIPSLITPDRARRTLTQCAQPLKKLVATGLNTGQLVTFALHNCQAALKQPARRVIRAVGSPPVMFAFEELETLLASIGNGWAAEEATIEESEDSG